MNAIQDNKFSTKWRDIGNKIPPAKVILVISAHYETKRVKISCSDNQKTIHDFYGFPNEIFTFNYPAYGDLILQTE